MATNPATGIEILKQRWEKDVSLLYKCNLGCFNQSILHVVASHGRISDVRDILLHNSELAEVLDSRSWSALHMAADKGHIDVLKELIPSSHHMARVKTNQGDTILHLCVKQNGLDALKVLVENIKDSEFGNRKDADGNNIFHLAVILGHKEIVEYLLEEEIVDLSSRNGNGKTVLDIASENKRVGGMKDIENLLKKSRKLRTKDHSIENWLFMKRDTLIIVASLMATMAFQACVNPPGGVWQENKDKHLAGESVMAYKYPKQYSYFIRVNTFGFMGSLTTILLLSTSLPLKQEILMGLLVLIMWLTIFCMAISYGFSVFVVTPVHKQHKLTSALLFSALMWGFNTLWQGFWLLNYWLYRKKIHPCPKLMFFPLCCCLRSSHQSRHDIA